MRPGQHNNNNNKNRNRNRNNNNRRSNAGGSSGNTGGNGANRVFDSNGPDVKLRGTAQTIAEKYMQLARDAHSAGDTVMAESYHQFGDHYYRVWLANQPAGQPLQFSRRMAEEEFEDDAEGSEADDETAVAEASQAPESNEGAESGQANEDGNADVQSADGYQNRQNNNNRQREPRDNNNQNAGQNTGRDGNRFRQRWPRRNERNNQEGGGSITTAEGPIEAPERQERQERSERSDRVEDAVQPRDVGEVASNWEAPSFLTRPTPLIADPVEHANDTPTAIVRSPRGRKPRAATAEGPADSVDQPPED